MLKNSGPSAQMDGTVAVSAPSAVSRRPAGWRKAIALICQHPIGAFGGLIVVLVILMAVLAPVVAPYAPDEQVSRRLTAPGATHIIGADEFGRDVFSRVLYGAQVSLYVGVVSVSLALVVGSVVGIISGFFSGWFDALAMRVVDIILAFPGIVLAIAMVGVLGPSLTNVLIAIGIIYAPTFARLARASTLVVSQEEYTTAAKVIGATNVRIVFRHIMPNIAAPLITQASLAFSTAILAEASLSFLGLGTQPPHPSWGLMLGAGRRFMEIAPWLAIYPGLAIMIAVLGFNLLGDGLRDALDPRQRVR